MNTRGLEVCAMAGTTSKSIKVLLSKRIIGSPEFSFQCRLNSLIELRRLLVTKVNGRVVDELYPCGEDILVREGGRKAYLRLAGCPILGAVSQGCDSIFSALSSSGSHS